MNRVRLAAALSALLLGSGLPSHAGPPDRDPRVERIVRAVSPEHIQATIQKLVSFGTRHTLSDTSDPSRGIGAARRWIKSELERAGTGHRMQVTFDEFVVPPSPRIPHPATVVNVVGTLSPRDPSSPDAQRIIVVSGHYDSRVTDVLDAKDDAPGADDDGSGTAVVLELARVLSKEDFRATLVFICFAGEEQGLYGSTHWAAMARDRGMQIEAQLNNDIVGGIRGGDGATDSSTVRVFSAASSPQDTGAALRERTALGLENDGASRSLARYVQETARRYVPALRVRMIYRPDRFLRGGDQLPFHQLGYAAVRLTEARENFDHQHQDVRTVDGHVFGDLPQFINPSYCANVARVNAAAAASLAFAPAPPSHAGIVVSRLAYDTELRWRAGHEPDLAGYLIRWRQTSSPVWEDSQFTADTTATLKISKDDVIFGVQSVDRNGDASLYSLPTPTR